MVDTLLTAPLTPDQEGYLKGLEDRAYQANTMLFNVLLEGYRVGDIALERALAQARGTLTALGISEQGRRTFLGRLTDEMLSSPQPARGRGKRGQPVALQKLAVELLVLAAEDGFPFSRSQSSKGSKQTAFGFVAGILAKAGFTVSEDQLIHWKSEAGI